MSYKRKENTVTVKFDGDYEGLEIVMKSLKIKTFKTLIPLMTKFEKVDENDANAVLELADTISSVILEHAISWNMEDDNGPVPLEELGDEDIALILGLFTGWTQSMSGVDQDLGKDSTSGETSPMPQIVMEML